jgi:uncharacterized protein (TIGR02246 family)
MIRMLLAALALVLALPAMAQGAGDVRKAIETAMLDSAAGWDAGDVDRFLAIYSDDPATSFTTEKGTERGKPGIRARYLVSYAGQFGRKPGIEGTRLSFALEEVRMLGVDHALLIARWRLEAKDKPALTGMTSLVFRKEAGGWKIVADHSS